MTYPVIAILTGAVGVYIVATLAANRIAQSGFPISYLKPRLGCIDGLRGYLALSVMVHHFIYWMQVTRLGGQWSEPSIALFSQFGKAGVAMFFMSTGFVFYPRILKGFRACSWPAVYISRVFRIIPLIAASVLFITGIIILRNGQRLLDSICDNYWIAFATWVSASAQPPLLGYADSWKLNAGVLWSLWYEWLFYLFMLPICALAMDLIRGRLPTWVIPASLLGTAILMILSGFYNSYLQFFPLFVVGMIAYELRCREALARHLRGPIATVAALVALALGMIMFSSPYTYAVPLFGFFFVCVASGNSMAGALTTRGSLVLGECSYGIYLLHGILLNVLFVDLVGLTALFSTSALPLIMPVLGAAIVLVTALTFLLIERPAMRLGSRISQRWTGQRVGPETPAAKSAP